MAENQAGTVASNLYSLAQSKFDPVTPLAIYAGEEMVGFVMFGTDPDIPPERQSYVIYRLMIDRNHQHKGYARAAMIQVMERLKTTPDCREVLIGFVPGNTAAEQLYRSLGFADSDFGWPGETVLRYDC